MWGRAAFVIATLVSRCAATAAPLPIGGPIDLSTVQWRTRCGNDPAWAAGNFDDTAWAIVKPGTATPGPNAICWYRSHVQVQPGIRNLGIAIGETWFANYTVFVNGQRIGGVGEMPPNATRYASSNVQVYPVSGSLAASGNLIIALSVWHYAGSSLHRGHPFAADLGLLPELNARFQNRVLVNLPQDLLHGAGIGLLVGLLAIGLFRAQPARKEYLWLGVFGVSLGISQIIDIVWHGLAIPAFWPLLDWEIQNLSAVAFIEFFFAFLGRRPGRWMRAYESSFAILVFLLMAALLGKLDERLWASLSLVWLLPGEIILLFFLIVEFRRRNREASILIFPTVLLIGSWGLYAAWDLLAFLHVNTDRLASLMVFHVGFLSFDVYWLCLTLFWLSMGVIILRRTARDTREQARLASEVDAARSVQQLLIPASAATGSEFQIEAVYLPASEVGGDFYQLLPGDDGSLLIVVGDVSGKGLRAALTVSAIVGALRGCSLRMPAEVLAHLNRVLAGQIGGFVTCCAAHISTAGVLTLANAGHIPPYRNGEELAVESELPLGIASDVTYREVQYQLDPNDRLTFVSDGVMEATNQKRELFGFDRTREFAVRPAREIAEAARAFGQQDDITVLTMQYSPVAAYVA